MKQVVWFREEIFDPRTPGRQTYVRSVMADERVTLRRESVGVVIHVDHEGEQQEIVVPWDNVRQTLNVRREEGPARPAKTSKR